MNDRIMKAVAAVENELVVIVVVVVVVEEEEEEEEEMEDALPWLTDRLRGNGKPNQLSGPEQFKHTGNVYSF
jgi:hypothetical protein